MAYREQNQQLLGIKKKAKELKRIIKSVIMMDFSIKCQGMENEKFSILIFKANKNYV